MPVGAVLKILAFACIAWLAPPIWAQIEQNTSLNGNRLTYYPRPDANQCFADCSNNAACQGVTWIQAGTYNRGDAAMCYLLSSVSGRAAARGHWSMIKMPSGPTAPRPPPVTAQPVPPPPVQRPPARADPLDQVDIHQL